MIAWLKSQWVWHVTCRRVRWREAWQLSRWQAMPLELRDKHMLWAMGRLSSTDEELSRTEVGGITTDQYIAAMKRRDAS